MKRSDDPVRSAPEKSPRPGLNAGALIPAVLALGIFGVILAAQMGYIKLPHIDPGQPGVVKLADVPINVPYRHDFSGMLIPLLGPQSGARIYTFYLDSGVGFPPMGLILGVDGVLKGTPTAAGTSKFRVCVKDAGGTSSCLTYSLTVTPRGTPPGPGPTPPAPKCPAALKPACGSVSNGVRVSGGIVPAACDCPAGSEFAQMDNVTAGGPYRICVCK